MITIVNIDIGNIGSIVNMLKKIGVATQVSDSPLEISRAERLILPGVGAFGPGMDSLRRKQLEVPLTEAVLERGTPILGVCLGMQLLAEGSEEGATPGLGWIEGNVVRLRSDNPQFRVPQMGWNVVRPTSAAVLFDPAEQEPRFYFAHSFHMECADAKDVAAQTTYGSVITVAVQKQNIFGVQFHPEKSHRFGRELLRRFSERTLC